MNAKSCNKKRQIFRLLGYTGKKLKSRNISSSGLIQNSLETISKENYKLLMYFV